MNLNFDGEDRYNTVPGGLISIFLFLSIFSYALIKTKIMVNVEEWSLKQQTVLQNEYELKQIERMRDYSNVTLALQFRQKRKELTNAEKKLLYEKKKNIA